LEFTNSLNQREKQELIIKLRKDGKTYREIAHIARVSLREIKPTLKKYERKLQIKKREENNQKTTKNFLKGFKHIIYFVMERLQFKFV
jgi:DNA invertase Pin-like site-specific DNA recombinase